MSGAAPTLSATQRQAIQNADAQLAGQDLPTYSELLAALEAAARAIDEQPAPLFVNSSMVGGIESIEVSTVPGSLA